MLPSCTLRAPKPFERDERRRERVARGRERREKKSLVLQIVVVVTGTTRQVFDLIDFVPDKDKLIENMTS